MAPQHRQPQPLPHPRAVHRPSRPPRPPPGEATALRQPLQPLQPPLVRT